MGVGPWVSALGKKKKKELSFVPSNFFNFFINNIWLLLIFIGHIWLEYKFNKYIYTLLRLLSFGKLYNIENLLYSIIA